MRTILTAAFALLVTACAPTAKDLADQTALADARPTGPPVDCLPLTSIGETHVRDGRTIDFELRNGNVYRNTLPHQCPGLGFDESFSYETSLSQLCSLDIITVLHRTGGIRRGASCGLGKFQPIETSAR